jgi:hypothetical protein
MRTLPLPPFLAACTALTLGGAVFAALFAPLAWRCAPEVLAPALQRLRRRSPKAQ